MAFHLEVQRVANVLQRRATALTRGADRDFESSAVVVRAHANRQYRSAISLVGGAGVAVGGGAVTAVQPVRNSDSSARRTTAAQS
jgi:hypothetical protein